MRQIKLILILKMNERRKSKMYNNFNQYAYNEQIDEKELVNPKKIEYVEIDGSSLTVHTLPPFCP